MKVIKKEEYIEDLAIQMPLQQAIENNTIDAIPLYKIKQARDYMENEVFETLDDDGSDWFTADKVSECITILDRLIESEEKE
jgi:hypothetical protein